MFPRPNKQTKTPWKRWGWIDSTQISPGGIISHQVRVTSHEFRFLHEKGWIVTQQRHVTRGIMSHQVRGGKPRIQDSIQTQRKRIFSDSPDNIMHPQYLVQHFVSGKLKQIGSICITGHVVMNMSHCQVGGQFHVPNSVRGIESNPRVSQSHTQTKLVRTLLTL